MLFSNSGLEIRNPEHIGSDQSKILHFSTSWSSLPHQIWKLEKDENLEGVYSIRLFDQQNLAISISGSYNKAILSIQEFNNKPCQKWLLIEDTKGDSAFPTVPQFMPSYSFRSLRISKGVEFLSINQYQKIPLIVF